MTDRQRQRVGKMAHRHRDTERRSDNEETRHEGTETQRHRNSETHKIAQPGQGRSRGRDRQTDRQTP